MPSPSQEYRKHVLRLIKPAVGQKPPSSSRLKNNIPWFAPCLRPIFPVFNVYPRRYPLLFDPSFFARFAYKPPRLRNLAEWLHVLPVNGRGCTFKPQDGCKEEVHVRTTKCYPKHRGAPAMNVPPAAQLFSLNCQGQLSDSKNQPIDSKKTENFAEPNPSLPPLQSDDYMKFCTDDWSGLEKKSRLLKQFESKNYMKKWKTAQLERNMKQKGWSVFRNGFHPRVTAGFRPRNVVFKLLSIDVLYNLCLEQGFDEYVVSRIRPDLFTPKSAVISSRGTVSACNSLAISKMYNFCSGNTVIKGTGMLDSHQQDWKIYLPKNPNSLHYRPPIPALLRALYCEPLPDTLGLPVEPFVQHPISPLLPHNTFWKSLGFETTRKNANSAD